MTTPTYTSPTSPTSPTTASASVADPGIAEPAVTDAAAATTWHDRADGLLLRLGSNPRLVLVALDLVGIGLVWAAFSSPVLSPEIWFHGVFVVLVLHAFLFGLRGTLVRIGVVTVPLVVYANADTLGLSLPEMELTEWPLMFVIAGLVAWMADRRETTSRRYAALYRRAAERLLTVQEDERRRIARELHDGVGQVLTALRLTLDAKPDDGGQTARRLTDTALAETRDLAERLRPARLDEIGLVHALNDLAKRAGFPVRIDAAPDTVERDLLSPRARVEVYRIVQEALANAARHSGAAEAVVTISRSAHRLAITVSDAGSGFDPQVPAHVGIGLAGMQERAALIGATLRIDSHPGAGTRVRLEVPVSNEPAPSVSPTPVEGAR